MTYYHIHTSRLFDNLDKKMLHFLLSTALSRIILKFEIVGVLVQPGCHFLSRHVAFTDSTRILLRPILLE